MTANANIQTENLEEDSISSDAIDFEDSSFIAENDHSQENQDTQDTQDDTQPAETKEEKSETPPESEATRMEKLMKEIASQPIEVAMANLEVSERELQAAAEGVFSKKGYAQRAFTLPFGGSIVLRTKSVNDFIDYTNYVRRLLLEPISKNEYDTYTQLRNLAYAIVELDGEDLTEMDIEEKFQYLRTLSDAKVAAIITTTVKFWRVSHLLLHPELVPFLSKQPKT